MATAPKKIRPIVLGVKGTDEVKEMFFNLDVIELDNCFKQSTYLLFICILQNYIQTKNKRIEYRLRLNRCHQLKWYISILKIEVSLTLHNGHNLYFISPITSGSRIDPSKVEQPDRKSFKGV